MQPPTDKFLQILAQGRYRLHDRYSAKGENAWSPLLQGIGLFEFNLKALHLNDRQRAEALDKLVYFKRTYAAHEREHFLDGAMRDLKKWKRLCVAMPDMIGDVLYDEDYIRYLRKGDPRPGLLTAAASETRNPTKKAHICVVQHSIPMIATGDPSRFNEDKYRRDAGVLEGLDPTLYQNYVQHLARKYFLEKKYDKLLKTLELYSQLNDDPNIQTEEQSAPCFFRALILLEDKKFEEAEKLLSRTIAIRKQYGISEGMSEILAYHGRALEEMGETEKAIEVYKKGRKMGFFMANKYGYDLCLKNLGRLLK
jgi:tetratricopeptide (TPR) repeat protein